MTVRATLCLYYDYVDTMVTKPKISSYLQHTRKCWKHHCQAGYVKLNTDFACFEDDGGGLGVILHDHNGCVIMVGAKWLPSISEVTEG